MCVCVCVCVCACRFFGGPNRFLIGCRHRISAFTVCDEQDGEHHKVAVTGVSLIL